MINGPEQVSPEAALDKRHSTAPGSLPRKVGTVTSAVLAAMLRGKHLSGMDAVVAASTTRLSDVVFRLDRDYGWTIQRRDMAVGTHDGRVATVCVYWLSETTVSAAFERGAAAWIESVAQARADQRQEAGKARLIAARRNQLRLADPRQGDLLAEVRP